jgi:tetratricopeptide (TPR) repeat protein
MAAQSAGDYDVAITFYEKAYELIPHPLLLFNIAQAHRLAGRIEQAETFYQRFLTTDPSGPEVQIARDQLAEIRAKRVPPPPPPPPEPTRSDEPTPSASAFRAAPWYSDKIGDALVVGGIAAAAVAAIVYFNARSDIDDARSITDDYGRASSLNESGHDKRNLSVVFAVGGCSLVAAGILRYRLHDRRVDPRGVDVAVTPQGGVISYKATF